MPGPHTESGLPSTAEPAARSRAARGHLPALDGLRGLAILVVLLHNVGYFEQPGNGLILKLLRAALGAGWVGVQLFFVLSGFLITGILLDTKHRAHYFRSFYVRRVLRIFPLYYLTLFSAFVVLPHLIPLGSWGSHATHVQIWYWTYLSNWSDPVVGTLPGLSHFWSLAVEEQFYLVWPLVVLWVSPSRLVRICSLLVISALVVRIVLVLLGTPPTMPYDFTIARWDALACGAALAVAMRDPAWYDRVAPLLRRGAVPMTVVLVVVTTVLRGFGPLTPLTLTIGQSATALIFSVFLLTVVDPTIERGRLRRFAEAPWLRFFGKYSYGMYVVHPPIHRLGSEWFGAWVVSGSPTVRTIHLLVYIAANLAASTIVAVAVWHLIERPFLSLKDRLAPRDTARAVELGSIGVSSL